MLVIPIIDLRAVVVPLVRVFSLKSFKAGAFAVTLRAKNIRQEIM